MKNRIEVEEKFFVYNIEEIEKIAKINKFCIKDSFFENDEYFTDIDSNYIKNRTCLRLRNTNNDALELTFKGKSNEFSSNSYAKLERNIELKIKQYDDFVKVLEKLGFYSYVVVEKNRKIYTKNIGNLVYNIMIDEIKDVGNFVEFEILSSNLNVNIDEINIKLKEFINKFSNVELKEAKLPYRDFVAKSIFEKIKPKGNLTTIFFDLDGTLIDSEMIFFDSFKETLKDEFDIDITFNEYEENELCMNSNLLTKLKQENLIDKSEDNSIIMNKVYKKYMKKFKKIIKEDEVFLNFELIKKIKKNGLKIGLVSTSKRCFIDLLLEKLNINKLFDIVISREDVEKLKPDMQGYVKAMKKLKVNPCNCIAIEDSKRGIISATSADIKTIRSCQYLNESKNEQNYITSIERISSTLLIIINNINSINKI